jgi:hypothetical protein
VARRQPLTSDLAFRPILRHGVRIGFLGFNCVPRRRPIKTGCEPLAGNPGANHRDKQESRAEHLRREATPK